MSRLSIRPRPLDIHKKLPIVKSVKDFEDEETPTSTRNSQYRITAEAENEVLFQFGVRDVASLLLVQQIPSKKVASEIPIPQFVVVDTYERDYSCTFTQPTSYLRARGARAELGEFVEYDVDNEDEDWLEEFNKEKRLLSPEKVLDHKARERAGVITPSLGSPIPVLLQFDAAAEYTENSMVLSLAIIWSSLAILSGSVKYGVLQSIYNYWKEKRERWQKPILRRLQPPPPVHDTNPYIVFRPREKAHRLHTRRMQRRENNVQSFEKLRQVRRNFGQAKSLIEAVIKREEKKREVMESDVSLQRIQMKYKHETELLEDSMALSGLPSFPGKFASSEEEFMDLDDVPYRRPPTRPAAVQNMPFMDSKLVMVSVESMKREFRRRSTPYGWLHKLDPLEPVLLFTKPLDSGILAAAGIAPPSDSLMKNGGSGRPYNFHGRIGRGGRIVFDRWNPLMHTPIDCGNSFSVPPKPRP
ncbi:unnamed protein product [Camellia sinensis]